MRFCEKNSSFFRRLLWMLSYVVPSVCSPMTVFVCLVCCVFGFVTLTITITPLRGPIRRTGNFSNDSVGYASWRPVPSSNQSVSAVLRKMTVRPNASVAKGNASLKSMPSNDSSIVRIPSNTTAKGNATLKSMPSNDSSIVRIPSNTTAKVNATLKSMPSKNGSFVSNSSSPTKVENGSPKMSPPKNASVVAGDVPKKVVLPNNVLVTSKTDVSTSKIPVTSMSRKLVGQDFFRDIIMPSVSCAGRNIELIICVPVKRDNAATREVIRLTWGTYARKEGHPGLNTIPSTEGAVGEIVLVFFIGSSSLVSPKAEQGKIVEESKMYGDIYQADYIDTYENLTLKSISILKFVSSHCPNARYVAKIDDDMYVNIPVLLTELRKKTKTLLHGRKDSTNIPPFVYGALFKRALVIRNKKSKWYTSPEDYKPKFYPNYLSGTTYAMSGTAALSLYQATLKVQIFWLEDIYVTGMCAAFAKVPLIGNNYLCSPYKRKATGCTFKNVVSGHQDTASELITIHAQLNSPFLKC